VREKRGKEDEREGKRQNGGKRQREQTEGIPRGEGVPAEPERTEKKDLPSGHQEQAEGKARGPRDQRRPKKDDRQKGGKETEGERKDI
jgi:hypothetical protein